MIPSIGSLLGIAALVNALFIRGPGLFAGDGDVGRHIGLGRLILRNGSVPNTDTFSHTRADAPFTSYEWLSATIMAQIESWLGLPGIAILSAGLYVLAVLGAYRVGEELGAPRLLVLPAAILALLLQSLHLLPRPHLFTTALAALCMILLIRYAKHGGILHLLPLPLVMVFWANAHPGFLIGFALLGAFLVAALLRSKEFEGRDDAPVALAATLMASLIASLANPAGIGLWTHTLELLNSDFLISVTNEFQSVDFHEGYGKVFFAALFAGPVLWATGRVTVSWLAAGLYLVFAFQSLHSARYIPLFTVVSLPWLGLWAKQCLEEGTHREKFLLRRIRRFDRLDRQLRPLLPVVAAGALVCLALGPASRLYRFDANVFPVHAASALDVNARPEGRIFNEMDWGGYLIYERPDIRVFIDPQTDFYGEELTREFLTALKGLPGWSSVLDKYDVSWTLTRPSQPLNQLLELDDDWELVYADHVAVVYRRRRVRT